MSNRVRSWASVSFVAIASCAVLAAQARPYDLDETVAAAMKAFYVPGMAVAVVKDGQVVSAKGYGVKTLGEPAPVDDRTLFGIASNTKVFTAAALGTLIDERKFAWGTRVVDVLSTFRLSDPYVTREMTIRDLLVHRSGLGLGAGDLLWWPPSTYTRKENLARLAYVPLATSFRYAYAYDNVLYLVAGEVIEAVTGQTWEDYVLNRVLKRIGMTTSVVRYSAGAARADTLQPASGQGVRRRDVSETDSATAAARNAGSKPSLPLERYAATYTDRWYGDISIASEGGRLVMRFTKTPQLVGDLGHWQYDTFLVKWRERDLRADAFVTFSLTPEGAVRQATMKPASPSVDFSFDFQDLVLIPKQ